MFAAIFVPDLPLQAVLRQEPELRGRPVALVNDALPPQVAEISVEAQAWGVARGMTSAQAQGRCTGIAFRIPGETLITSARDCLLQCAGMLSPWIEATGEGVATIEWREWESECGTEGMGGIQKALEKAVDCLERLGFSAQAGAASNPDLAGLAARCARPVLVVTGESAAFLAQLPLHVIAETEAGISEVRQLEQARALEILHRWGIRTLGKFAALPRAGVIQRLGMEGGVLWERARGCSNRLLKLVRVPEHFMEMHEFDHEVETLEPLLFILRRFVEQLAERLVMVHRVVAVLKLELRFDRNSPHERELKVPSPTADVEVLFRMLSTHLEQVSAESPVVSVKLEAVPVSAQRSQFDLFSTRLRDPNQFYETLAQLTALLGPERVGSPVLLDSYRADAFRVEVPQFDDMAEMKAEEQVVEGLPLRRFRPRLRSTVQMQGGRPAFVQSEIASGIVEEVRGPWLSSGEWWTAQQWMRVEWDVQLSRGVYRLVQEPGGSWLEGCYD